MSKKKDNEMEDFEDDNEIVNDYIEEEFEETFDVNDISEDDIDEDDEIEDVDDFVDKENHFDFKFLSQKNKHKLEGKHSLNRDVLFVGKLDEKKEEGTEENTMFFNDEVSIETGSQFEYESRRYEDYVNDINLEKDVFEVLKEKTKIDFTQSRRKPKREDFNSYYELLQKTLKHKYTNCELFVVLSYYFTDNIFNMYKLLDRKHAASIIIELRNKGYLGSLNNINFV